MGWLLRLNVAVGLVTLFCGLMGASPASAGTAALETQSFSQDTFAYDPADSFALDDLKSNCPRRVQTGAVSVKRALGDANRFLDRHSSARARRAMARARAVHNPRLARALATAAILKGRPLAALAVLLDAHHRHPRDQATLVALSAILTDLGLDREGLALATHSGSGRSPAPMGIPLTAARINNQGFALLKLGRLRAATRMFSRAIRVAPRLGVARLNLADTKVCLGASTIATPPWPPPDPPLPPSDPSIQQNGTQTLPADQIFDLSAGTTGSLPDVSYPKTAQGAADSYQSFFDLETAARNEFNADEQAWSSAEDAYLRSNPNSLSQERFGYIISAIPSLFTQPKLAPLWNEIYAQRGAADQVGANLGTQINHIKAACGGADNGCFDSQCAAATADAQQRWLSNMVGLDQAVRTYFAQEYHFATGLAANLADPNAHAAAMDLAKALAPGLLADQLYDEPGNWGEYVSVYACPTGADSATGPEGAESTPASAACPDSLHAMKFTLKFSELAGGKLPVNVKLSVKCEKVDAELAEGGPIGLFGSGTYNTSTGQLSIFMGGRAGVQLPGPLRGGPGLSGKTGIYVNFNSDGSIADIGWRFSPSGSFESPGGVSVSAGDSMDFSFMGLFD